VQANNFSKNALALWEGPGQVQTGPGAVLKACLRIIEAGWYFEEGTSCYKIQLFIRFVIDLARNDIYPNFEYLRDNVVPQCYLRLLECEVLKKIRILQEVLAPVGWGRYVPPGHA